MSFVHVQAGVFGGEAVIWMSTFSSGEYFLTDNLICFHTNTIFGC